MAGIPPTGTAAVVGFTNGLNAADYGTSVTFYTAVFDTLGLPVVEDSGNGNTEFGYQLLVQRSEQTTQGASVFIQAAPNFDLGAIVRAVRAAGFENFAPVEGIEPNPTRKYVKFADPAGNTVWVTSVQIPQVTPANS